jgi:undecaprenyl-diphosphatase
MSELEALILGVVQGLTEFLPISSSGHLILVPWLLDFHYLETHEEFNKTFDVALHAGTLAAVLVYFRAEIVELVRAAFSSIRNRSIKEPSEKLVWLIVLATIPAAAIGAIWADRIEEDLGEPWQIAILLAVFGIVLWIADRLPQRRDMDQLSWKAALAVGFAQAVALAPGTSRSGITITAGRFLGLTRDAAARFSFLLLAPVTFGAVLFKGIEVAGEGLPAGSAGPVVVGIISAAVSGFAAIWALLRYVRTHGYEIFVVYRLIAAAAILMLIATNVKPSTF